MIQSCTLPICSLMSCVLICSVELILCLLWTNRVRFSYFQAVFGQEFLAHVDRSARKDLAAQRPIGETISTVLRVLKRKYATLENRLIRKQHYIPSWALMVSGISVGVVFLCLFLDWMFLSSRKLRATQKMPKDESQGGWKAAGLLTTVMSKRNRDPAAGSSDKI